MNPTYSKLIQQAYRAFNAREIDNVLALMHPAVQWPNGWEGGYVQGHQQVRDYWTRQWSELDPQVHPIHIKERPDGRLEVDVQQTIKDRQGNLLATGRVLHLYTLVNGKIYHMEIIQP